jgi:surfactin family lipopeptide synthetase B/lichenysin synthetase B
MHENWTSYIEMFSATAARLPDKKAVVLEDRSVTYQELDAASSVIAHELAVKHDVKGKIVPITLPRSPEAIASILGIWKAGAAGTLVDLSYPRERIDDILGQCGRGFIIDETWINTLSPFGKAVPEGFTSAKVEREQLALVVFTSGSTGQPKGVMLPHRGIARAVKCITLGLGLITEIDEWLHIVSFSFVLFITDGLLHLFAGATVHLASDAVRTDPVKMLKYVAEHKINTLFLPPSSAGPFMEKLQTPLRSLFTGSEKVGSLWGTKTKIVTLYGSTETCSGCFIFVLDKKYDNAPIGKPNEGTRVYLLDEEGKEVPAGEAGELYIAGEQVALGYLNQPELTAEHFLPNPFTNDPASFVMYRTHDIARLLPDGNYEYVQRADWMIKVRGYRVEPSEIEIAMMKAAPLLEAVVVGFNSKTAADKENATKLYAVYTAKETIDPRIVRDALTRTLPDYMVPAFIEQIDALPKNARGKLDRKSIVPPDVERYKREYIPPRTETEKIICGVFEKVLGVDRVGILDEFTLLGGNSVAAARAAMALPEALGLSVGDILIKQTPQALAETAEGAMKNPAPSFKSAPKDGVIELTPFHKIFHYEWLLDPGRSDYNIVDSRYFNAPLSYEKLNSALIAFVNGHYLINSNIIAGDDDRLYWKKRDPIPAGSRLVEYIDHPLTEEELYPRISKPFDLQKDLLVRFFLIREHDSRYRFISVAHHLVMDGTKSDEVYEAMRRCYNTPGFTAEKTLDEQAVLVEKLSAKLNAVLEENREQIDAFWREYLKDAVPVDLKFLKNSGAGENALPVLPVGAASFVIDKKDLDKVRVLSRHYGITPYIYGQIIFAILLNKMTGQKQISFAFPAIITEGIPLIYGAHINTLVANYRIDEDTTFEDLAEQAKMYFRDLERARARYLPVNEIAKYLDNKGILDALFAQTSLRYNKFQFDGIDGGQEETDESLCIDLIGSFVFEQEEKNNQLFYRLRYKNRIFDRELIENFTLMFKNLFLEIADDVLKEIEQK